MYKKTLQNIIACTFYACVWGNACQVTKQCAHLYATICTLCIGQIMEGIFGYMQSKHSFFQSQLVTHSSNISEQTLHVVIRMVLLRAGLFVTTTSRSLLTRARSSGRRSRVIQRSVEWRSNSKIEACYQHEQKYYSAALNSAVVCSISFTTIEQSGDWKIFHSVDREF